MVILYIIQRRKDNLMGGLEVHEHQLFTIFSEGSHPVGVPADPVHTCQEVSGDGDRIDVEGNDVRRHNIPAKKFWLMEIGLKSRGIMHASVSW